MWKALHACRIRVIGCTALVSCKALPPRPEPHLTALQSGSLAEYSRTLAAPDSSAVTTVIATTLSAESRTNRPVPCAGHARALLTLACMRSNCRSPCAVACHAAHSKVPDQARAGLTWQAMEMMPP